MAVIPEIILHKAIVSGLQGVRRDPRLLDVLFKNLNQADLQAMKDFITKEKVKFTVNYPRDAVPAVPAICLILKSENEGQPFVGNIMGAPPHWNPARHNEIDTLGGHAASTSSMRGLPEKLLGPIRAVNSVYYPEADETQITFSEAYEDDILALIEGRDSLPCIRAYIVDGQGEGQTALVKRIHNLALDIEGDLDVHLDNSSLVTLRHAEDQELPLGEPSKVYDVNNTALLRKGVNYDVQYQLSILAGHQEEVLYLYSIIKALLLSQTTWMESQGIIALKLSGTDFAPRSEYLPNEVFQRQLVLQFSYPFDFVEEQDVFDQFRVNLVPTDINSSTPGVPISFDLLIE